MPRASAQPQASLYESTIENAELEEALEERERKRTFKSSADKAYRDADEAAKGLIRSLEMGDGAAVRVGRFVIVERYVEGGPVSCERSASTKYQILMLEDAA